MVGQTAAEWKKINDKQNRLAAERRTAAEAASKETAKQKRAHWMAEHNVPSTKSLKTLDAKLAEIKHAEDIENESRNK